MTGVGYIFYQGPRRPVINCPERCDKPTRNASAYQNGNIDHEIGDQDQHRAPRGPLAPKRTDRVRARKGAPNSGMFWIDLPEEAEQLRGRRRGG